MNLQWIEPADYPKLEPILDAHGWTHLNPSASLVIGAFDGDKLTGFFALQTYPILGPLWVAPEYRGQALPMDLALEMKSYLDSSGITGWLIIADSPHTEVLCKLFGMKLVNSPVYML